MALLVLDISLWLIGFQEFKINMKAKWFYDNLIVPARAHATMGSSGKSRHYVLHFCMSIHGARSLAKNIVISGDQKLHANGLGLK